MDVGRSLMWRCDDVVAMLFENLFVRRCYDSLVQRFVITIR